MENSKLKMSNGISSPPGIQFGKIPFSKNKKKELRCLVIPSCSLSGPDSAVVGTALWCDSNLLSFETAFGGVCVIHSFFMQLKG